MKYECLLWDVDGTLLDFEYSQKYAIRKCLQEIGISAGEDIIKRYSEINDSYWKRLELGEITKAQLLTGRFVSLFKEYGILCEDVESFRHNYQEYLGSVYQYLDHSLEICEKLNGRCRQFVVTNGVTSTQINKLKSAGFADIMEGIFISEEVGAPKPQKAFFDACFARMGEVSKEKILIIGDSLSSDILGGINAGIDTCWYNPSGQPAKAGIQFTYQIDHLSQIQNIIE